jgi:hypothetical protein
VYHSHRTQCGRKADGVTRRRLDLRGAAEALGTSVDAVRKRIARGTLESEKADGKVYVWLDDGAPRSDTERLISTLEEQLALEREAHAEARRLLAAALERIPAVEAREVVAEAPGAPETVSEMPMGPEPPEAGEEAQAAAEHPRQQSRWSAQVRKFPLWAYVLVTLIIYGSSSTLRARGVVNEWYQRVFPAIGQGASMATYVAMGTYIAVLGMVGLWIGLRFGLLRWQQAVPLAVAGGLVAAPSAYRGYVDPGDPVPSWVELILNVAFEISVTGTLLLSFSLFGNALRLSPIGNALRRKVAGGRTDGTPGVRGRSTNWSPPMQAVIAFAGTVLAALITVVGNVVLALLRNGG